MNTQNKGKALITGASSGIGEVYAERLADRGYDLVLVARRLDRLEALARKIAERTGRKAEVLQADLGDRAGIAAVERRLAEDEAITLLINNAGISLEGSILENGSAQIEKLITVNTLAPTLLAAAAAKAFVARDRGGIVNIASVLAFVPEMMDGLYSGTKAHLLNITLGLASKLQGTKVRAQAVLPGATRSEIWEKSGKDVDTLMPGMVMDTADLVDAALVGYDRGEVVTIPPLADEGQFKAYDAARLAMAPNLSRKDVAPRYRA
ncbi:SDR family NAD(P)-dependent oxidoreductase [Luteibacter yeojuensis]|uniref:SDR family NAD(P)-dependent oxidoreductase n=1 Tax=Luteibacter yeojuensis TaxID=345309 RepID=A0A7X5QW94_9GAMM|nr:SDR family NAD(P)-dependent oxidoreductase [Luteibacter yeojuensis]NID16571.1 SDR family NAD(P)-dependent oxidoreductase [Luteibacter yeojuensis]